MKLEIAEILNPVDLAAPGRPNQASRFLVTEGGRKRYVLGRNAYAEAVVAAVDIDGVVDDFAAPDRWREKPVVAAGVLTPESIVVNCALGIRPVSAARRLRAFTPAVLGYTALCWAYPDLFPLPDFVRQSREDLERYPEAWQQLYDILEDDASRTVLTDVLRYRATGDAEAMKGYSVRLQDQYFEEFLGLGPGDVFVDAGGFTGDTTEEFCLRCPEYGKVFLFEPSAENMQRARSRLKSFRDIVFLERGLSDQVSRLRFNPLAGSASAVDEEGGVEIEATTLDLAVQEPVSFIKMDLEGWELPTLAGARQHILNDHPKLAVAAYHHPADFRKIPDYVLGLRSDYRVYLRHYTEGWTETIMFFIPG